MNGSITRRGKRSWRLKYDLPRDETGARRIAYATVKGTRAEAEKELRRRLTAIDKGMSVDPSAQTVAEYLDEWLSDVAPASVGEVTLIRYRSLCRIQIKPHLGRIPLQKLRPRDVSIWLQALRKTDLSARSVQHAHAVLRCALNHAAAVELVERNVASVVKPPSRPRDEVAILTSNQITDTLAKIEGHWLYPIVALAIGSGARRGEIAALTWADIDLDAATVRIARSVEQSRAGLRIKPPKTAAGVRTVSLPVFVIAALRVHRQKTLELRLQLGAGALPADAPVFGSIDGGWRNPQSITDSWRDAVKSRGLPSTTFHSLRHFHASALIAAGLDVVTVSRRLGHANPGITLSAYSHLFQNKDAQAAEAIDAVLAQ